MNSWRTLSVLGISALIQGCGTQQITISNASEHDLVSIRFGDRDESKAELVISEVLSGNKSDSEEISSGEYDVYYGTRNQDAIGYAAKKIEIKPCDSRKQTLAFAADGSWTVTCN